MELQGEQDQPTSNDNKDVATPEMERQDVGNQSYESADLQMSGEPLEDVLSKLEAEIDKEFASTSPEEKQEPVQQAQNTETIEEKVDQVVAAEQPAAQTPEDTTPKEYTPDHTYKAMGETYEFDKELIPLIKTQEDEDKWRSIMSKAKGLEFYEEKHKRLEDNHARLQAEHETKMTDATQLASIVTNFNNRIASTDLGLQFKALQDAGIDEQGVLNIAQHVLNLRKLDPSQRQAYDSRYVQQDQLNQFQSAYNSQQQKIAELETRQAETTLSSFLSDKQGYVTEFENRDEMAKGDFARNFIQFGLNLEQREGKPMELGPAFDKFKKIYQLKGSSPEVKSVEKKPLPETIPNLQASGHSPINKPMQTMEDFENYAESITTRV